MSSPNGVLNKTMKMSNELFDGYSNELLQFAAITCIIFIVLGVPGNILTILALSRGKRNRNSTAVFIINLSLADLLFDCFNLPLAASTFLRRSWIHGELLCRLFPLLRYGLLAVSLFMVSLITINRYIIIVHPRSYARIYQRRYLYGMILSTWLLAFAIMMPTWRGIWGKFGLDVNIGSCSILPDKDNHSPKEFLFTLAFFIPCVCIVFCYTRIFCVVRQAALKTREPPPLRYKDTAPRILLRISKSVPQISKAVDDHVSAFSVQENLKYIDDACSLDNIPISYESKSHINVENTVDHLTNHNNGFVMEHASNNANNKNIHQIIVGRYPKVRRNSVHASLTRFHSRGNYTSMCNTSNASSIYPGRMSQKDRHLLIMIFTIFVSFVICYLPITILKIWKITNQSHFLNISSYLLIYLTTCINPIIYVMISTEYRQAYWELLRCHKGRGEKKKGLKPVSSKLSFINNS